MCLLNSIQYANSIRIKIVFGKECVLGYVGLQAPKYEAIFKNVGESNIRHLEDSDLQILGFRCFTMDISRD